MRRVRCMRWQMTIERSSSEVAVPDDALTEEDEDILNYDDIDDPDAFA